MAGSWKLCLQLLELPQAQETELQFACSSLKAYAQKQQVCVISAPLALAWGAMRFHPQQRRVLPAVSTGAGSRAITSAVMHSPPWLPLQDVLEPMVLRELAAQLALQTQAALHRHSL